MKPFLTILLLVIGGMFGNLDLSGKTPAEEHPVKQDKKSAAFFSPLAYELTPPWKNRATRVGPRQIAVNLVDGILRFGIWKDEELRRSPPVFEPNGFSEYSINHWTARSDAAELELQYLGSFAYPEQSARNTTRKPMRQFILLGCSRELIEGEHLVIQPAEGGEVLELEVSTSTPSDLVHVPHSGFVPNCPDKHAMIGGWYSPGINADAWLSESTRFALFEAQSSVPVPGWTWDDNHTLELTRRAETIHAYAWKEGNDWTTKHAVYVARFPEFAKPGKYRLEVEGIGASHPFEISDKIYRPVLRHLSRGFIHLQHDDEHRAKIVAKPLAIPPTLRHMEFVPVSRTFASIRPDGIGDQEQGKLWDPWPIELESDPQLQAFKVDHPTEGWRDAADYDIRPQHLEVATEMLWFSMRFAVLDKIPMNRYESGKPYQKIIRNRLIEGKVVLPDWFHLALSCGDAFTRLQVDTEGFWHGSVRGGFEMRGYIGANIDFQSYATRFLPENRMHLLRPDPWASFAYAAFAATAALKFQQLGDIPMSEIYHQRALKAWRWAVANEDRKDLEGWNPEWRANRSFLNAKANAAVAFWGLTGEKAYEDIFAAIEGYADPTSMLKRRAAATAYWMLHQSGIREGNPAILDPIRAHAIEAYRTTAVLGAADPLLSPSPVIFDRPVGDMGHGEYFMSINQPYRSAYTWFPIVLLLDEPDGPLGAKEKVEVQRWINADIAYMLGRNPHGRSFITGYGHNPPRSIHLNDLQGTGLSMPFPGLVPFGLVSNGWLYAMIDGDHFKPSIEELPYHYRLVFGPDIHRNQGEFTPQNSQWPLLRAFLAADYLSQQP